MFLRRRETISDVITCAVVATALVLVAGEVQRSGVVLYPVDSAQGRNDTIRALATALKEVEPTDLARWSSEGHLMGRRGAPVRILEFGSFTCGACRELHHVLHGLRLKYPDLLSISYVHFVSSDGDDMELALGAECASEQVDFQRFHNLAFERAVGGTLDEIGSLARGAGVRDSIRFYQCMEQRRYADKIVAQSDLARRLRFPGTPTWFINDRIHVGVFREERVDSIIKSILRSGRAD